MITRGMKICGRPATNRVVIVVLVDQVVPKGLSPTAGLKHMGILDSPLILAGVSVVPFTLVGVLR